MGIQKQIADTLSRSVCGGWDRTFLESILEQLSKGRQLSIKQKEALGKVLARNTAEDQKIHQGWKIDYEREYKVDGLVLAAYHSRLPYYRPMAHDILTNEIPNRTRFLKMYNNKYSKKVLAEHAKTPRYAVSEHIVPRTNFNIFKHVEVISNIQWSSQQTIIEKFKKRGGFVMKVEREVYSHAKGAKRYKILPVGEINPIIVEERFLKPMKLIGKEK